MPTLSWGLRKAEQAKKELPHIEAFIFKGKLSFAIKTENDKYLDLKANSCTWEKSEGGFFIDCVSSKRQDILGYSKMKYGKELKIYPDAKAEKLLEDLEYEEALNATLNMDFDEIFINN